MGSVRKCSIGPCSLLKIPWKQQKQKRPIDQGRKNSININFLVRISRGHSWPLRSDGQGSKSFSPPPGPQENALFGADVHDFRRGCPWPEGLSKNFVQKKFALIFWPHNWEVLDFHMFCFKLFCLLLTQADPQVATLARRCWRKTMVGAGSSLVWLWILQSRAWAQNGLATLVPTLGISWTGKRNSRKLGDGHLAASSRSLKAPLKCPFLCPLLCPLRCPLNR